MSTTDLPNLPAAEAGAGVRKDPRAKRFAVGLAGGVGRYGVMRACCLGAALAMAMPAAPAARAAVEAIELPDGFPGELLERLVQPNDQDFQQLWTIVQQELESGSLEDLAWMLPYVRNAAAYMSTLEDTAPLADWLRQRLDYFEAADEVVSKFPPPRPAPHAQLPVTVAPRQKPPKLQPAPAAVQTQRGDAIHSARAWKRKLASRPPPENAVELAPQLKTAFRNEGVPPQLIWIAEVESTMNPDARSPSGAAGLFQFMPATAQRFGLRTWPFDERRNPKKSARAAAQYLKLLHRQFGTWPLCFAAYNAGEGAVGRLLKGSSARTFEAIADRLPIETQMYVPKVLAVVSLRENVDALQLPGPTADDAPWPPPPATPLWAALRINPPPFVVERMDGE